MNKTFETMTVEDLVHFIQDIEMANNHLKFSMTSNGIISISTMDEEPKEIAILMNRKEFDAFVNGFYINYPPDRI